MSLYWFVDLESNNRHLHMYFLICVKVLGLNRFFIDLHKQELEFWIWSGVSASFHGDHEVIEGTPIRQDWQLILYSVCLQCSYSTSYCICAYKHTYKKNMFSQANHLIRTHLYVNCISLFNVRFIDSFTMFFELDPLKYILHY